MATGCLALLSAPTACTTDPTPGAGSDGGDTGDSGAGSDTDGGGADQPDAGAQATAVPFMIAADNYLEMQGQLQGLGPFIVYAWCTDPAIARYDQQIGVLEQIDAPGVTEMVMFSSHVTMTSTLARPGELERLQNAGVTVLGYNTEGFMTPAGEMNSLNSSSAQDNAVARFASIASDNGFESIWGPIRLVVDQVPDAAISTMDSASLNGVAMQEQRFIEGSCVADRSAAVSASAARYRSIAGDDFSVTVQIMPTRCDAGDSYGIQNCGLDAQSPRFSHCRGLVEEIAPDIDYLAVWASGPDDRAGLVELLSVMRAALNP